MGQARHLHQALTLPNGSVLVSGGLDAFEASRALATSEIFQSDSGTWQSIGELSNARCGHSMTLLGDGRVIVLGGWSGWSGQLPGPAIATGEILDDRNGEWRASASLAVARGGHTATLLENQRVLVTGGLDNDAATLGATELFRPE
jgi:N-acetylneuraminic acid mutarotase